MILKGIVTVSNILQYLIVIVFILSLIIYFLSSIVKNKALMRIADMAYDMYNGSILKGIKLTIGIQLVISIFTFIITITCVQYTLYHANKLDYELYKLDVQIDSLEYSYANTYIIEIESMGDKNKAENGIFVELNDIKEEYNKLKVEYDEADARYNKTLECMKSIKCIPIHITIDLTIKVFDIITKV